MELREDENERKGKEGGVEQGERNENMLEGKTASKNVLATTGCCCCGGYVLRLYECVYKVEGRPAKDQGITALA